MEMSLKMESLKDLVDYAKEELRDWYYNDNPQLTDSEGCRICCHFASLSVPSSNYHILILAANNLVEIGTRITHLGEVTPVNVAAAAIYDYLEEALLSEWRYMQESKGKPKCKR